MATLILLMLIMIIAVEPLEVWRPPIAWHPADLALAFPVPVLLVFWTVPTAVIVFKLATIIMAGALVELFLSLAALTPSWHALMTVEGSEFLPPAEVRVK